MNPLGHSRTTLRRTHALIAPDSHVTAPLPGWENARGVVAMKPLRAESVQSECPIAALAAGVDAALAAATRVHRAAAS